MSQLSFLIVLLCAGTVLAVRNKLILENCGGANDVIQMKHLSITPMPITIPGNLIISANVTVTRDLSAKTKINVKLYKQTKVIFPIDIKIPCIKNAGSCSYDGCSLISLTKGVICDFFPKNVECACPFKAGKYGTVNYTVKIPSASGIITWLAKGDYKAEVRIQDESSNKQLGCFRALLSLGKK
uniref:MD-2-related lipid-recognition domain-containing protein n=1 Tax=Strigamia maritima TaxID=126957 RepID=T1J5G1_STRMM